MEIEFSGKIRELEQMLMSKDSEVNFLRESYESKLRKLERELNELRKRSGASLSSSAVDTMKQSLEEAYSLVSKLEKENKMLLARIDHLENDNVRRTEDNQRLYNLFEEKTKVTTIHPHVIVQPQPPTIIRQASPPRTIQASPVVIKTHAPAGKITSPVIVRRHPN